MKLVHKLKLLLGIYIPKRNVHCYFSNIPMFLFYPAINPILQILLVKCTIGSHIHITYSHNQEAGKQHHYSCC